MGSDSMLGNELSRHGRTKVLICKFCHLWGIHTPSVPEFKAASGVATGHKLLAICQLALIGQEELEGAGELKRVWGHQDSVPSAG